MSFFRVASVSPFPGTPPPLPGGNDYVMLFDRVMECLGSKQNIASFSGVHEDINAAKGRVSFSLCFSSMRMGGKGKTGRSC
jgi:hypothetical protein